jgi:crossover junction endodeoxyribonuclease RuvC
MVKIIGIDPGLAGTGIGIVWGTPPSVQGYAFGDINTDKCDSIEVRLDHIFSRISRVLTDECPNLMVVEDVFSLEKYPKSGITLGKVSGVILLAGRRARVGVVQVPVREAKKVLTGNGNATKLQLERATRHALNHPVRITPFHASDALALALIGLYRYETLVGFHS